MKETNKIKHFVSIISIICLLAVSINCINAFAGTTATHNSKINWDKGYRWITAETQAYYKSGNGAKTKIGSYTRCRFERAWFQGGGSYGDSGRCWGKGTDKSSATSGKELFKTLDSGEARSYWGTE